MMSQGLAIEDALVARPDTLFGVRFRSLGEMLSDALAPTDNLLGLLAVVLEGGLQVLRIYLMHVCE
jgi:hypothetical protein